MTKAHTVQTTAKEGYLLAGYYASVQAAMVNIYVEVRKSQISSWQSADNFSQAVTPAYRYAPEISRHEDRRRSGMPHAEGMKTGGEPESKGKLHSAVEECRNIYSKEVLSEAMNA